MICIGGYGEALAYVRLYSRHCDYQTELLDYSSVSALFRYSSRYQEWRISTSVAEQKVK